MLHGEKTFGRLHYDEALRALFGVSHSIFGNTVDI